MSAQQKRILVTGSNGQLGKSLQDIVKDFPNYSFIFKTKEELDITNALEVENVLQQHQINYCINCAAYTKVDQAEQEPEKAFEINAESVKNLAAICNKLKVILIHISTDYVFDGTKKTPYTITDATNPINMYGMSKLKGEGYIQEQLAQHYIIRTSWLYHKKYGKNFYKTILQKAKNGEALQVTHSQTGCPTNAVNLAGFIMKLIEENAGFGIFHFCDAVPMTWYDFAKIIVKENGLQANTAITKKEYPTIAKRPAYSVLKVNY